MPTATVVQSPDQRIADLESLVHELLATVERLSAQVDVAVTAEDIIRRAQAKPWDRPQRPQLRLVRGEGQ